MASRTLLSLADVADRKIRGIRKSGKVVLTGDNMDVGSIVAVALHACSPIITDESLLERLGASVAIIQSQDIHKQTVYGVNTGFGGSSDLRTSDVSGLEKALLQTLQSGVRGRLHDLHQLDTSHDANQLRMPPSWVHATITARLNQCLRGHSAISRGVVELVAKILEQRLLPITPLRGSISSSGDLMPLSYLAGLVEGNPDVFVSTQTSSAVRSAPAALAEAGLKPLVLGPREALGLVNGTAASVATASLAMYNASNLSLLGSTITCMVCEGLAAQPEWLEPFVNEIQPHAGQREVSTIMRALLQGSSLVSNFSGAKTGLVARPRQSLSQDRYPLRTAPQWLGPQYEDLVVAYSQITTELNSTTDNPVVDHVTGRLYHVGNFQATAVTMAMEKARSSIQMVGKLLFAQFTEMVNHTMSAGLPSNLAADDPSTSFCLKGLDINMAAYQAELGFLANSVNSHVQSAEMHNQAVNSLAFVATRYTMQALDVLSLMVASSLFAACQAMDLRVMHALFLHQIGDVVNRSLSLHRSAHLRSLPRSEATEALKKAWWDGAAKDAQQRCIIAATTCIQVLSEGPDGPSKMGADEAFSNIALSDVHVACARLGSDLLDAYEAHREDFFNGPSTRRYLGAGTGRMYDFVRRQLGIAMHRGLEDQPVVPSNQTDTAASLHDKRGTPANWKSAYGQNGNTSNGVSTSPAHDSDARTQDNLRAKSTIGSQVSLIHDAIRDGRIYEVNLAVARELDLVKVAEPSKQ